MLLVSLAASCGVLIAAGGKLEIRFLAERVPPGFGQFYMVAGEVRSAPFEMPSKYLSEPFAPPAREFQIRSGEPEITLCSIRLPEKGASFVAILIPDPKGGYRSLVIRSDDPDFRPGDICFYNHTDQTILGFVGSVNFSLDSSSHKVLRPTGARAENFYDVGFGIRKEDQDRVLSTTRWPVDPMIRSYVFFYLNPATNRLDYRAVDEFVEPKAATSGAG